MQFPALNPKSIGKALLVFGVLYVAFAFVVKLLKSSTASISPTIGTTLASIPGLGGF